MKDIAFIKRQMTTAAPVYSPSKRKQLGGMMIESLIGLLLLGIIGGGILHTSARMANTQRDLAVNNVAVNQMRNLLMTRKAADGTDICVTKPKIKVPGMSTDSRSAVDGVEVDVKDCASATMKINGVVVGGTGLGEQTVSSAQPLVLEVGTGDSLVRIGGVGR